MIHKNAFNLLRSLCQLDVGQMRIRRRKKIRNEHLYSMCVMAQKNIEMMLGKKKGNKKIFDRDYWEKKTKFWDFISRGSELF